MIDELQRSVGGRRVDPLHITCDRVDDRGNLQRLIEELTQRARSIAPTTIRATSRLRWSPDYSSKAVLKYVVEELPAFTRIRDAVREATHAAAVESAYETESEWTVTVLEGIDGQPDHFIGEPFVLFVADRFLISRIAGIGSFETVDEIGLGG